MLIYLVEDDNSIRELVAYTLHSAGFEAEGFERPSAFWRACAERRPDLVLLDLMLPEEDGISILKKLRQAPETAKLPILLLTAKSSEYDKVLGLDSGADDYVVKPFDLAVLYSRILALLRRTKTVTDTKLFCDDLMLDKEKTAVYDGQKEIVVSQPEYRILLILMENKGKTITRNQLLEQVWDRSGNYVNDNTLTVTMKRLREKLNHPACLKTIRSFGYRMEDTQ